MFSIPDGSFKSFENYTVKLLAKETKWTSLEVKKHPILLESLISKYGFGPVKLPGLSRNGPLVRCAKGIASSARAGGELLTRRGWGVPYIGYLSMCGPKGIVFSRFGNNKLGIDFAILVSDFWSGHK